MKENISLHEFADYIKTHKPGSISYCAEKQPGFDASNPLVFDLEFDEMIAYENPNTIYLKQKGQCAASIHRIRHIKIDTALSSPYTIITVFCGNFRAEKDEYKYILVLS